jgi:ribosome-binding factor A
MTVRQQKVASQIRRLISDIIARDIADPRVNGLVSVTKVNISPDLREAKVFLSVLGQKGPAATVLAGIRSGTRHIQKEIGRGLAMRSIPHLSFELDESLKKEAEILRKINALNAG